MMAFDDVVDRHETVKQWILLFRSWRAHPPISTPGHADIHAVRGRSQPDARGDRPDCSSHRRSRVHGSDLRQPALERADALSALVRFGVGDTLEADAPACLLQP